MKKVLCIAYFFPPAGSVGVYRTLKFAKYLPDFGWQPVVLTTSNGKFPKFDETLMDLIPEGTAVHRSRSIEAFNEGYNQHNAHKEGKRTLWSRIHTRVYLVWNWLAIPDTKIGWVPSALMAARRIVRRDHIEHVYISGSPFSSFLIGAMLKWFVRGVHVIIDYRDPWTQNITYLHRSGFHTWLERRMESWVVRRSSIVVANTRMNNTRMIEEFGAGQPGEKFVAIHNGFDAADFDRERSAGDRFTITYAGAFYFSVGSDFSGRAGDSVMQTYSPLYFFEALEKLFTRRPELKAKFRVNFMGVLGHGYDSIIKERGLEAVVERIGYIDYDAHIDVLKNSDALLLVLSRGEKSRGWIPSKFYQYLGSGNPILALVPQGEVRDIIKTARAGVCVEPDDVDGASHAIEQLVDAAQSGAPTEQRNEDEVGKYERRYLTGLLARALDRA